MMRNQRPDDLEDLRQFKAEFFKALGHPMRILNGSGSDMVDMLPWWNPSLRQPRRGRSRNGFRLQGRPWTSTLSRKSLQ